MMEGRRGAFEISAHQGLGRIRHRNSGELMHARWDPYAESLDLYVAQTELALKLRRNPETELVVWDVGLGAASNAMAAIEIARRDGGRLRLLSFERDLDPLRLALSRHHLFPYLDLDAAQAILDGGEWREDGIEWRIQYGPFEETHLRVRDPDIVFFDPFSRRTDPPMWDWRVLSSLAGACLRRGGCLVTYSVSTALRASLLAGGMVVARGKGSGGRTESTCACAPCASLPEGVTLLGPRFLEKWRKSSAQLPLGLRAQDVDWFKSSVASHPQFGATGV